MLGLLIEMLSQIVKYREKGRQSQTGTKRDRTIQGGRETAPHSERQSQ